MTQAQVSPSRSAPHRLSVARGHRMAWCDVGDPDGEPWLVLHGGPGSGGNTGLLAPLERSRQRALMPDQRGSGASRPRGATTAQTAATLVADLEALRRHLSIEGWSVLAGSWGTVPALAYAQAHPQRVKRLVLRGAFALSRREVANLLLPRHALVKTLGLSPADWPARAGWTLPVVLRRLAQLLQSATPAVASLRALRTWGLMENAHALRGQRRASLHAPRDAALRRQLGQTRRHLRRLQAALSRPRRTRADRLARTKFRVQGAVLRRRAGLRTVDLDRAVMALARQGIPVDWVHGAFDAVCPPANSRRWAALGLAHGGRVRLTLTHAGHLAHEPATARALRDRVRTPWA
jgi:proline iminopeptidase